MLQQKMTRNTQELAIMLETGPKDSGKPSTKQGNVPSKDQGAHGKNASREGLEQGAADCHEIFRQKRIYTNFFSLKKYANQNDDINMLPYT